MVTDEEKELFKNKLEISKSKSMGHFIRKSVLEAPIFVIDMNIFRKLQMYQLSSHSSLFY